MALDSVEQLVKYRIPFLGADKDPVIESFKLETYWELHKPLGIEKADAEDDSQYTGLAKALVADVVACQMLYHLAVEGVDGNVDGLEKTVFAGSGVDDVQFGGSYNGETVKVYEVRIASTGTPDQFEWSEDGGSNWEGPFDVTTDPYHLSDGVTVRWENATGHNTGDKWIQKVVQVASTSGGTYLTQARAGEAEAQFAANEGNIGRKSSTASFSVKFSEIWDRCTKSANRKAHKLGFILDICSDCSLAIEMMSDPDTTLFVGRTGNYR